MSITLIIILYIIGMLAWTIAETIHSESIGEPGMILFLYVSILWPVWFVLSVVAFLCRHVAEFIDDIQLIIKMRRRK